MITGAHAILYSTNADADRAFLRDVLGFPHVDVGHGWLIFGLPPSEVAVHPGEANDAHELYLMTDDVDALVASLGERGVACSAIEQLGWGRLTKMTLPGGGKLGVYQPRHARPPQHGAKPASTRRAPAKRAKAAKRPPAKRSTPKKTARNARR